MEASPSGLQAAEAVAGPGGDGSGSWHGRPGGATKNLQAVNNLEAMFRSATKNDKNAAPSL